MLEAGREKPLNHIKEVRKAFGVVPAAFATLIDLGEDYVYSHLAIVSELNQGVTLQFTEVDGTTREITLDDDDDLILDGFRHYGVIKYKYTSVAPASGDIVVRSW